MTPQAHLEQKMYTSETQVKQLTASVTSLKLTISQKLANTLQKKHQTKMLELHLNS